MSFRVIKGLDMEGWILFSLRKLKFNPALLAIVTIWVPHLMTKLPISTVPKSLAITAVVFFQVYLVYLGIERINDEKALKEYKKQKKTKKKSAV